jgi:hypothetical protein
MPDDAKNFVSLNVFAYLYRFGDDDLTKKIVKSFFKNIVIE